MVDFKYRSTKLSLNCGVCLNLTGLFFHIDVYVLPVVFFLLPYAAANYLPFLSLIFVLILTLIFFFFHLSLLLFLFVP